MEVCNYVEEILQEAYDIKRVGIIGFGQDQKELEVLNRTVRVRDDRDWIELEADSRHVKRIVEDYGLTTAKSVATPRQKRSAEDTLLQDDLKFQFRSRPVLSIGGI